MPSISDHNIKAALKLVGEMKSLADKGQDESGDYGCAMLYGVIRDCAYKIGAYAEREQSIHRDPGGLRMRGREAKPASVTERESR